MLKVWNRSPNLFEKWEKKMTSELTYMSAIELLDGYKTKKISPVEATRAALDQISKYDGALNAFMFVDEDGAMAAAKASEERWQKEAPQGLVDGVPTTVKDVMLMKGFPTLKGSKLIDPKGPWEHDSPAVERLREHGAVFLGKTTTPEFGYKGVTDSPLSGITRNPWDADKTPGGSSGGAAAACAAGMGALHTGSDGGGSVRIPAAFTGIFGLKPSFGRIPVWPASAFGSVSHVGPMTRNVADAALMLDVMKGFDARDWQSLPATHITYANKLEGSFKGKKIAYSRDLGYAKVDPEIAKAVDHAVDLIRAQGAEVVEIDPGFENPLHMFTRLWFSGASYAVKDVPADKRLLLDDGLQDVVFEGDKITLENFYDATVQRTDLGILMRKFHETFDLLLTPALSVTAFKAGNMVPDSSTVDAEDWVDWTPFTYPFNLTQQPACSVPCGLSTDGLPIGLQIVGPMHKDHLVLEAAAAFEAISPVTGRRPDLSKLG
jgi:aspartyl-tRNA(Asn)/glutamyl-tRNA(Gln) amidotransferase subunit A